MRRETDAAGDKGSIPARDAVGAATAPPDFESDDDRVGAPGPEGGGSAAKRRVRQQASSPGCREAEDGRACPGKAQRLGCFRTLNESVRRSAGGDGTPRLTSGAESAVD